MGNKEENCGEHEQILNKVRAYREMWRRFDHGEKLATGELLLMKDQAEAGLAYLTARGESLASTKTSFDIATITSMLSARHRNW